MDIKEIVQRLNERVDDVVGKLLPNGRRVGRMWEVGGIGGEPGRSLKVNLAGEKAGIWCDHADGGDDAKGDLLDLWAKTQGLALTDAIREAKEYLGITEPTFVRSKKKEYRKPTPPKEAKKLVEGSAVMEYLTKERKLSPEALALYRIGEISKVGPWPNWKRQEPWKGPWVVFPFFRNNELLSIKYLHLERPDNKKQTLVEADCEPTCFGWHAIPADAREVCIAEGELDCVSLWMYGRPSLSVPFGAGKGDKQQWVDSDWEHLERMESIYLCMDNDKEGAVAVDELVKRLGIHRCKVVTLPRKDANKCLQDGVPKEEIDECFRNTKQLEPEELKAANYFSDQVVDRFYPAGGKLPGFDIPWKKILFRFLRGEVSIISGHSGHGKSLMWGFVMLSAAMQGEKICIASLEMAPATTLHRLVRQATGKKYPGKECVVDCLNWMSDKFWLFNLVGTGKVDRLLEVFMYAYRRHGIQQFVIDSLMKVGIEEDDYNKQKDFVEKLCEFAAETGAHVHLIAHPRKDDEMVPPDKFGVKGNSSITNLGFNFFSIWKNIPKFLALSAYKETQELPKGTRSVEDLKARPDALLVIGKGRNVEDCEGKYGLWFHHMSMQFLEEQDGSAEIYFRRPEDDEQQDCPY